VSRRWSLAGSGSVVDGIGAARSVGALLSRRRAVRPLVLSNRSLWRDGLVEELVAAWAPADGPVPGPPIGANAPRRDVDAAVDAGRAAGVDAIVAVGGSSVTDAAKIVRLGLLAAEPDAERVPLVLVPTTLSSGETTPAAGMTGDLPGEKSYVIDPRMAPTTVVLDPEVTLPTPRELWLSSGVKALDHACEALWSLDPHPYSDALARDALDRLLRALPSCADDPTDLGARHDAQIGGWLSMAGMTRHGPGPSHLLGHQLAARWGIGHGITSCVTLPAVLEAVAAEGRPGVATVVSTLGARDASYAAGRLRALIASLGLPSRLGDLGADPAELDAVAEAAWRHGRSVGYDPAGGAAAFADLLRACW
jgi:maleylacetate reductase